MLWRNKLILAFWAGLFALVTFLEQSARAQTSEQVKPRILLVVDISGSMNNNVAGPVPESCSGGFTRFEHAKCAIQRLVEVNGDIEFALSQFRKNAISGDCADGCVDDSAACYACGTTNAGDGACGSICNSDGSVNCSVCNATTGANCTPEMSSADQFQLLVPFTDTSSEDIGSWVDFSCGNAGGTTCSLDPVDNPELTLGHFTPIGGALRGAKRFFEGDDPVYDEGTATDLESTYGIDPKTPIELDPFALVGGLQCRPYIVITLTDGAESCETFVGTEAAAGALLTTPVGGFDYRVETRPIGFGLTPGNAQIEAIAHAGGNIDVGGVNEGLYANNEEELFSAFNSIIADSIKVEQCNGIDDDCDGAIDEGFDVGDACDDGEIGFCLDPGTIVCDASGDFSFCNAVDNNNAGNAPVEVCNGLTDDCDVAIDEGLNCVAGCTEDQLLCAAPDDDCCDGFDNDCDGATDEDAVTNQECGTTDVGVCEFGVTTCTAGQVDCTGAIEPGMELCNGLDDDCDGETDNDAICPAGTSCIEGGCRLPCDSGEFPCSFGFSCVMDFCVPNPCTNCLVGESCINNECIDLCEEITCESNEVCNEGQCQDCHTFGCPEGQVCFEGECQSDACDAVDCGADNCIDGLCVPVCDSTQCPSGESCNSSGQCATDPCAGADCRGGEICVEGSCVPDPCSTDPCRGGDVCVAGECVPDRCLLTDCADGQHCETQNDGTPLCVPDAPAGPTEFVSPGGGGGCGCSTGNPVNGASSAVLFLLMLCFGFRRRQR